MRRSPTNPPTVCRQRVRDRSNRRPACPRATSRIPTSLPGGHAVKLLRNGVETFPAWLAAIESARARISLEMYIFSDDTIGRQFADALIAAARRGVEVRLLYDFVGCRDTPAEFFDRMRAQRRSRDRLPPVPLLAAAFLGALAAQSPQDAGVRRPHRLRGRPEHLERMGVGGRRRRRLARRRHPGRRPGGRGHRGDLPAHVEPAREEVGARRSGAAAGAAAGRHVRRWS